MEFERRRMPAGPGRRSASDTAYAGIDCRQRRWPWWFLFNASPDLRQQIEATPCLHPRHGLRSSPIAGVVLTGGDVDAIAGLLTLRERQAFTIYGTARMHQVLDANPIFEVLARDVVARQRVAIGTPIMLALPDGSPSGLSVELFAVPGKVPLYLEDAAVTPPIVEGEETVGAVVTDGNATIVLHPWLRGHDRCTRAAPARRRCGVVRRHAVDG